jgi:hypothetical protein
MMKNALERDAERHREPVSWKKRVKGLLSLDENRAFETLSGSKKEELSSRSA